MKDKLELWEDLIRKGHNKAVVEEILALGKSKIPRKFLAKAASLLWRANAPVAALKLLNKTIYPENPHTGKATVQELIEYSQALNQIGAFKESKRILSNINEGSDPSLYIVKASTKMAQWNYQDAIDDLEKYIKHEKTTPYQKMVGQINLGAAYLGIFDFAKCRETLNLAIAGVDREDQRILYGNILELVGQSYILEKKYDDSREPLQESLETFKNYNGRYKLWTKKWLFVSDLMIQGVQKNSQRQMNQLINEAESFKDWETQRDLYLFWAIALESKSKLEFVYYGTSFKSYREKIHRLVSGFQPSADGIILDWSGKESLPEHTAGKENLDLFLGQWNSEHLLKPGQLMHRLMIHLFSDGFRPSRVAQIHESIYDEPFYDPIHSYTKTQQIVWRLRGFIKKFQLPFALREDHGFYQIAPQRPFALILPPAEEQGQGSMNLKALRDVVSNQPFTAQSASVVLGYTKRNTVHLLNRAIENKDIEKTGQGRATRYRFVS